MACRTEDTKVYRVLFVCLGNICRSPAAEAILHRLGQERGLEAHLFVDSAGIYGGHVGNLPDPRMRAHAARRGYLLEHRSRPITEEDFDHFDLIIGMDDRNIEDLRDLSPDADSWAKIHRMTEYSRHYGNDAVPDPYYSGADGFECVLNLLEDACEGLLETLFGEKRG
ncbi:MAG: low molecular weight phosphotyrosine protein phosphatase [Porphyromonadaceae bacterium]|nr:low molecular weight phosphotyrosine protein phosphatase [Porphyromonadaceae bacterium]